MELDERNSLIFTAVILRGESMKEVAANYGISHERVGQIVLSEAKRRGIVPVSEKSRSVRLIRKAYFRHISMGLTILI